MKLTVGSRKIPFQGVPSLLLQEVNGCFVPAVSIFFSCYYIFAP